ncbi:MAG: ATP synthase F1 subunit delta [Clostridia bacterium]|nr:ATP synthase F1 subunit delta [Clostridia bacterium]
MSDVSKEYGAALYQLAREEDVAEQLLDETKTAEKVLLDNPAYVALLSSPDLSKEERSAAVVRAFAGGHRYLLNFLSMMVERGYSREIAACFAEFRRLYREDHGIAVAKVTSARTLTDEEKSKLTAALARRYGVTVEAEYKTDPALLGGMKVEISGMLLDGSARRRLDGVRADLSTLTL